VDGKVTLKHRARRPEGLDTSLNVGAKSSGHHLGRRRFGLLVEAQASVALTKSAELDVNVGAGSERLDRCLPARKHLVALAPIHADSKDPTDVVGDDSDIGERPRKVCKLEDLGMIERHVVGKAHAAE